MFYVEKVIQYTYILHRLYKLEIQKIINLAAKVSTPGLNNCKERKVSTRGFSFCALAKDI